jgi:hypothetical protein
MQETIKKSPLFLIKMENANNNMLPANNIPA